MSREEAIEYLRIQKPTGNQWYKEPTKKAFDMAIEALEKQIPQKPKIVEVDMEGMDMETGEEYTYKVDEAHCSRCDSLICNEYTYTYADDCHCSKCGQKIDWSCWE